MIEWVFKRLKVDGMMYKYHVLKVDNGVLSCYTVQTVYRSR